MSSSSKGTGRIGLLWKLVSGYPTFSKRPLQSHNLQRLKQWREATHIADHLMSFIILISVNQLGANTDQCCSPLLFLWKQGMVLRAFVATPWCQWAGEPGKIDGWYPGVSTTIPALSAFNVPFNSTNFGRGAPQSRSKMSKTLKFHRILILMMYNIV